jgi:hypothetical protein
VIFLGTNGEVSCKKGIEPSIPLMRCANDWDNFVLLLIFFLGIKQIKIIYENKINMSRNKNMHDEM